ncbi:MAG: hypothetical protein J5950_10500 [Clostridia bacterium]|nr:hypothetical protein [Clostridia bacterium]
MTFHALSSQERKDNLMESAQAAARANIDENDRKLAEEINEKHDYSNIGRNIICKKCGQIQTWSDMKRWSKKKLFPLWLIGLFFAALGVVVGLMFLFFLEGYFYIDALPGLLVFAAITGLLLFIWLRFRSKEKKKLAIISDPSYPRPIYVSRQNFIEVMGNLEKAQNSPTETQDTQPDHQNNIEAQDLEKGE